MLLKLDSINTRFRVVATVLLLLAFSAIGSIRLAGAAFLLAVLLAVLSDSSFKMYYNALKVFNIFSIFVFVTVPLQTVQHTQQVLFAFGAFAYTLEGMGLALLIVLKGNAMLLLVLALLGACSAGQLALALKELKLPEKLVTIMLLVARHISVFQKQFQKLHDAAKLRGFKVTSHPKSWKIAAYFMAMLLIRCFDKTMRTEKAMQLRGFTGKIPVLFCEEAVVDSKDRVFLVLSVGATFVFTYVNIFW